MERNSIFNLILLFIVAALLCAFQTTFWYQITGGATAPQLWLNLIIYLILFRKPFEGLITIYLLAVLFRQWTAMPLGVMWLTFLIFQMIMTFLKARVFWPGTRYFVLASAVGVFVYHIIHYALSRFIEPHPAPLQFLSFLLEAVLTPIWAAPIYWLMSSVDSWTKKDLAADTESDQRVES